MKINEIFAGAALLLTIVWIGAIAILQSPAQPGAQCAGAACAVDIAKSANAPTYAAPVPAGGSEPASSGTGTVEVTLKVAGGYYEPREIRANEGDRVKINFDQKTFVGCMSTFNIYDLGIKAYVPSTPYVEFVAGKSGTFRTGCNMGMGYGKIVILPKGSASAQAAPSQAQNDALPPLPAGFGGSCGGSGGGCGCGG